MIVVEYLLAARDAMEQAGLFFGHGTSNAFDEACAILINVLNLDPECDFNSLRRQKLSSRQEKIALSILKKRITTRKALAYICGFCYYRGFKFKVNEHVLVPRSPFFEIIEAQFKPWCMAVKNILELGTGCGALAILCAHYLPKAKIDAVEYSKAALLVAQENIKQQQLGLRVQILHSNWFCDVPAKKYEVIFTNPPYVSFAEYRSLPKEYKQEPKHALCAKDSGLADIHKILRESVKFLNTRGVLFIEVGGSWQAFKKAYKKLPFFWVNIGGNEDGIFGIYKEDLEEYNRKHA